MRNAYFKDNNNFLFCYGWVLGVRGKRKGEGFTTMKPRTKL